MKYVKPTEIVYPVPELIEAFTEAAAEQRETIARLEAVNGGGDGWWRDHPLADTKPVERVIDWLKWQKTLGFTHIKTKALIADVHPASQAENSLYMQIRKKSALGIRL